MSRRRDLAARRERDGVLRADSPLRRMATPTAMALAGGRAILMELAHPSVAQGIAEFDRFREDPARRAHRTVRAFRDVVHGSHSEALAVGGRLRAVHARVRGQSYRASDPELILWVHATFIDSLLVVCERLHRPLSDRDLLVFYKDAVTVGEIFGCPAELQPPTIDAFREYVSDMTEQLTVTDAGRALAGAVFWPRVNKSREPLLAAFRLVSYGTLPDAIRAQYGYDLTPHRHLALRLGRQAAKPARRVLDGFFHLMADGDGRAASVGLSIAGIKPPARAQPISVRARRPSPDSCTLATGGADDERRTLQVASRSQTQIPIHRSR